ncbi:uncharacterized protein L201_004388 [Kwoniella dendrophila CBS 6074]|uniref:Rad60/SUMO-like domain-containing protein n=1 Tax=Kwoniella dendrophila CBS 6074 TaxID=1295534 RepID=A0AAX4JX49_9TREE
MADKGKGKATNPYSLDSDSDDDFFTVKRKPVFSNAPPPKSPSPPPRNYSTSEEEDDSLSSLHKKKRKAPPKKRAPDLPAWTRHGSNENKKSSNSGRSRKGSSQMRGSTEERAETIVIDGSGDEAGSSSKASKNVRHRIVLTPPPEMSEQSKAEIAKLVREHLGEKFQSQSEESANNNPASSPEKYGSDVEKVQVTIRMVAPPEKKATAAPAAIKEYQKARTLTLARIGPMSDALTTLGDRIQKRPEDLILVYNDNRVYSRSTPAQLGIIDRAEMSGYEKEYWLKLEAERRKALEDSDDDLRQNGNDDTNANDEDDDVVPLASHTNNLSGMNLNGSGSAPLITTGRVTRSRTSLSRTSSLTSNSINRTTTTGNSQQVESHPQTQTQTQTQNPDIIHFKISSKFGEERMKGPKTLKLSSILRFYCKKLGKPQDLAEKMYIKFDGEKLDKELPIGETEVEDGDMLEVGM